MNVNAIVSLSGGLDSTTLLALSVNSHGPAGVAAVGFRYPSKHNPLEMKAASQVAAHYGVPFWVVDAYGLFASFRSDLLAGGGPLPQGHYEAESMRRTVVPCRNMIFASVLAGLAESLGAPAVYLGVHAGDHYIYPDCRPGFVGSMAAAVGEATEGQVNLEAPFLMMTKAEILNKGLLAGVPYRLTRTCYTDGEVACGKCGSCQERLASFAELGEADPLEYASRTIMPK